MHIEGPWLSNTSTKKRKEKITKARQAEIELGWRERNIRLKQIGLPKETLEQYTDWLYGRGQKTTAKKKIWTESKAPIAKTSSPQYISSDIKQENETTQIHSPKSLNTWITGAVSSKPAPTYTGSKMIGIGTMHKSNMVPIFSDEDAKDISKMRR